MTEEKTDPREIEKKLIPRLKMMGYILFVFSAISLGYSFTLPSPEKTVFENVEDNEAAAGLTLFDEEEESLHPSAPKTYYFFALVFVSVGFFCFFIARRKKTKLEIQE
ncbi:MAG: hypothetical protein A2Y28_01140 [Chlamydiae bacterium GWC2_50_10]|nr:MAG: hypothetical protein A2Y28_01140 [Chlamydiae bacterium GWC2_50_10]OGN58636.1 MAG: hypothetical protein A3D18_04755 [Chlamydiae bacterium RIFCSPHIGHO2_02_FULL_49_29]OGN63844.1 MAG: hypothetical protein A3E26_01115 [Chlamydiae bacterium RIFCSPHIGHO2_12_FULL_49_32]OGN70276.1 MAG: hypothetical protein A3I15_02590 [Chlamydiae bacterium RIFCSPLOWO2_02_FULL_49_12]OGN72684.1 MAG: hypothetical protein A3G30_03605 [Chlamydiae bacterium RIFCSPLOWO2_12_FULL_49_12]HCJ83867.1 hypothetical protein [P